MLQMASRFVSGGTNEEPTERDEAWLEAQKELDVKAVQKADAARQQSGTSLFETLQANKGDSPIPYSTARPGGSVSCYRCVKLTSQYLEPRNKMLLKSPFG